MDKLDNQKEGHFRSEFCLTNSEQLDSKTNPLGGYCRPSCTYIKLSFTFACLLILFKRHVTSHVVHQTKGM